jgi:hypothetical protein
MARPKGSKNKAKESGTAPNAPSPGMGHNRLDDAQIKALHFIHVGEYERALKVKRDADAAFKNACKRIKSENGSVDGIKLTIELRTPEGEARFKAQEEERLRIALWNGLAIGAQPSFFDVDRTPAVDKAKASGAIAGMNDEPCSPPYSDVGSPQSHAWVEGWHDGHASRISVLKGIRPLQAEIVGHQTPGASEGTDSDLDDALTGESDEAEEKDLRPRFLQDGGDGADAQ